MMVVACRLQPVVTLGVQQIKCVSQALMVIKQGMDAMAHGSVCGGLIGLGLQLALMRDEIGLNGMKPVLQGSSMAMPWDGLIRRLKVKRGLVVMAKSPEGLLGVDGFLAALEDIYWAGNRL